MKIRPDSPHPFGLRRAANHTKEGTTATHAMPQLKLSLSESSSEDEALRADRDDTAPTTPHSTSTSTNNNNNNINNDNYNNDTRRQFVLRKRAPYQARFEETRQQYTQQTNMLPLPRLHSPEKSNEKTLAGAKDDSWI
jgi:hypothetical protein